jgi:PAS domain S-box-containing protein
MSEGDILLDRRLFAALVEASSDFIGIADPAGAPIYLNPAGRRLVGFAPDTDISGTQIPEYYPEDERAFVLETIVPAVMEQGHWKGETRFRHWTTNAAIPVSDEHFVITDSDSGEVLGLGTITRDISALKDAQQEVERANERLRRANAEVSRLLETARELDAAKTEFFSNVSHELRTPLTLLLGPLEAAIDGAGDLSVDGLRRMHRNAVRLLRLVNNLLDFSRLEAGRLSSTFVPTELGPYTRELASAFDSAFAEAGLGYQVVAPADAGVAWVDRSKWEKVVLNLISNALKFTTEGSVTVELKREDDGFSLTVRDTGVGIPAEQRDRVFERFHRVRGAGGRSHEGAGIGLSLARELVRMHGGEIELTSEAGQGSVFRVTLPQGHEHLPADQIADSEAPRGDSGDHPATLAYLFDASSRPEAVADVPAGPEGAPLVLVVDDNADMRSFVSNVLSGEYRVAEAKDGLDALEFIKRVRPELLVTDATMPNLDGLGLVRKLREDPATLTLPVLMLSARAGAEASVDGLEAGADDYLSKPFTAVELLARVRTHVKMDAARTQLTRELARANKELEAFTSCASHDLKAPVRTVRMFGQLLQEHAGDALDDVGRDYLARITRAGEQMDSLIEDLLSLSQIAGQEVVREPVDLSVLAQDVAAELAAAAPERSVDVVVSEGLVAEADAGLARVLLANLLGNAWKYTASEPKGRIEVGVEGGSAERVYFVRDNGVGFDAQHADRLFQPFARLHSASEFAGTGVGLATVERIVSRHGGRVWGEGVVGRGATFRFTLGAP